MEGSDKLTKMRQLAYESSDELIEEKDVVGVLLYGSTVSGKIHERSDVDIVVVYESHNDWYPLREEKVVRGLKIDIWRYPITRFIHTFDDELYRDKDNSWIKTNFIVELMRSCQIIKDPLGKFTEWKIKAKEWVWREDEIRPVLSRAKDNSLLLLDLIANEDRFDALLCLRDATALLVCAYLMKERKTPAWTVKDPLSTLMNPLREFGHKRVVDLFISVNDLNTVKPKSLTSLLDELGGMIRQEYGIEQTETVIHYEEALACLKRGDVYGSVLSARMSAQQLGYRVLENRGVKLVFHWPDAVAPLKMVNECRNTASVFYTFYERIHDSGRYNVRVLNKHHDQLNHFLSVLSESPS